MILRTVVLRAVSLIVIGFFTASCAGQAKRGVDSYAMAATVQTTPRVIYLFYPTVGHARRACGDLGFDITYEMAREDIRSEVRRASPSDRGWGPLLSLRGCFGSGRTIIICAIGDDQCLAHEEDHLLRGDHLKEWVPRH